MAAIDCILTSVANPGTTTYAATTAANGDSLSVRNFPSGQAASLIGLVRDGATGGGYRVRSPRLHDNVTGINYANAETPSSYMLPRQAWQSLYSTDTLIVETEGGASETDVVSLLIYYSSLPGSDARLNNWGDIMGLIKNIKPFQTAVTSSATIGQWVDTVITTTENQLHANTDYAVLGYTTNAGFSTVGIKGQETGNLRISGPGQTSTYNTDEFFIQLGQDSGQPCIPVFNSNNRASVYVSVADNTASLAGIVTLICAELSSPAPH